MAIRIVSKNSGVTCIAGTKGGVEGFVRPGKKTGPSIPLPPTPNGCAMADDTYPGTLRAASCMRSSSASDAASVYFFPAGGATVRESSPAGM